MCQWHCWMRTPPPVAPELAAGFGWNELGGTWMCRLCNMKAATPDRLATTKHIGRTTNPAYYLDFYRRHTVM